MRFPNGRRWIGLAALVGLSGAASTPLATFGNVTPGPTVMAPNGMHVVEGVSEGNVTLFPIVATEFDDTSPFVALDEALQSGSAIVTEEGAGGLHRSRGVAFDDRTDSASVNRLVLVNRGPKWLVLLAGEVVSGGKQDRVIAKDRIVAPGADPLPLDVFCVERGRWSSGGAFKAAKTMVHPSVRERASVDQAQASVWAAIASGTTATSDPNAIQPLMRLASIGRMAPTGAYRGIYQSGAVQTQASGIITELEKKFVSAARNVDKARPVGVIVAYNEEPAWIDVFASPEMFDQYWSKLLQSYVIEGLARSTSGQRPSLHEARAFLNPIEGNETVESEPGAFRWSQIRNESFSQIALQALAPKEITIHRVNIRRTDNSRQVLPF